MVIILPHIILPLSRDAQDAVGGSSSFLSDELEFVVGILLHQPTSEPA